MKSSSTWTEAGSLQKAIRRSPKEPVSVDMEAGAAIEATAQKLPDEGVLIAGAIGATGHAERLARELDA